MRAVAGERPDYIAADLRSLHDRRRRAASRRRTRRGASTSATAAVTVHATGSEPSDSLSVVRATAARCGRRASTGDLAIVAGDDTARQALERWSLLRSTRSTSVNIDMSTDPDQIRAQIAALLAELPDVADSRTPLTRYGRHRRAPGRGARPAGARAGVGGEGSGASETSDG